MKRTKIDGFDYEDINHLIISLMLDGIKRYNNKLNVKVSTFLFTHVKNRLHNLIEKELSPKNNPTNGHQRFKFNCICGFVSKVLDKNDFICPNCFISVATAKKLKREKYYLTQLMNEKPEEKDAYGLNQQKKSIDILVSSATLDGVEFNIDFYKVFGVEDAKTAKIAELIYFNSYSIADAARYVGLSGAGASIRLKNLKNKESVKQFFNIE